MKDRAKGFYVNIGGIPTDLNSGIIEAVTDPPQGFVSKLNFSPTDVAGRLWAIDWFAHCGEALSVDLSMPVRLLGDWQTAVCAARTIEWGNVELEAHNQLTIFLHNHDRTNFQNWNSIVERHKQLTVSPLTQQKIIPFQERNGLDNALVHSVKWDILGALMENSYLLSHHSAVFFLELLTVYEAGHFPCGWEGKWPKGKLLVF